MPPRRASTGKRPDLSVEGGGAFRSPEPGLAAQAKAELEAATLCALHDEEAGAHEGHSDGGGAGAQAAQLSRTGSPAGRIHEQTDYRVVVSSRE